MIDMDWITLILQTLFFLFLSFFLFTIPGLFLLNLNLKKDQFWKNYAVSTTAGFVFLTLISYILLVINLNILVIIIILLIDLIYLKKYPPPNFKFFPSAIFSTNRLLITTAVFFVIGVIGQLLIIAPSGMTADGNLVFWSAHGRDGVWHLALINMLSQGFPFINPDFAGQKLANYHFFSDISIAQLNYFFKLPALDLYFRFFPLLFSSLLGILSFQFGKLLGKNDAAGFWAMVFTLFAGSFGYLYTFLKDGVIGGEALFWSSQIQSISGNPPQAIALIIILAFLLLFTDFVQKPTRRLGLVLILLAGTMSEFKIYGAVVLISSLFIVSLWHLIKTRTISLLAVSLGSILLALVLYLPNTSSSESLLLFEPWWFIRTMVVATDKLDWLDLELRRQTYLAHHSYLRVAQIEIEAFLIFLLGNLGLRFIGFWQLIKSGKNFFKDYLSFLMVLILLVSLILPMLFIQKGVPANTIQFFLYFLLLLGIFAGISTAQLLRKVSNSSLQVVIGFFIILLAVPTQIGLLRVFYSRPAFAQISEPEQIALTFLKNNSKAEETVVAPPFQKDTKFSGPTPPIWVWSDTSYVTAFSARRSFVSDIEFLDNMGYDYKPRLDIQKQIFSTENAEKFESLLRQNHITYLYFPQSQRPAIDLGKTDLHNIYQNNGVEIWKIN